MDWRSSGEAGRRSQQPRRREQRRWRRSSGCGGQKAKSTGHKAPRQQGKAGTMLSKSQDASRLLAIAMRTRRWCCRPRGRKARYVVSQWSQASRAGRLGAQGASGVMKGFAGTRMALRRRHGLVGVWRWRREKQRRRKEKSGDGTSFIVWP